MNTYLRACIVQRTPFGLSIHATFRDSGSSFSIHRGPNFEESKTISPLATQVRKRVWRCSRLLRSSGHAARGCTRLSPIVPESGIGYHPAPRVSKTGGKYGHKKTHA